MSCEQDKKNSYLPASQGRTGEILVVCDSLFWKSEAGNKLSGLLKDTLPFFSSYEPYFKITYIPLEKFSDFWKKHRTILFTGLLDGSNETGKFIESRIPASQKEKITNESFWLTEKDLFASDQRVHYLFAKNNGSLLEIILKEPAFILEQILESETKRQAIKFKNKFPETKTIYKNSIVLHLPAEFLTLKDTSDFIWWRYAEKVRDRNIFISKKPYLSQEQFSDSSLIEWHIETGKKFIQGNDSATSYLTIQPEFPLSFRLISINKGTGKEMKGLWKTSNNTMGGPFVALVFTDNHQQNLFFMEAFLYAPNEPKRDLMRELEGLLWTVELY